jgi:hypothetical protein
VDKSTHQITPQGSIMGKTQEANGAVAPASKPHKLFGVTFTTSRNLLQQAFMTQSEIGWDNFLKGRISRDWLTYVHYNEAQ